jgi:hypothetical protein
LETCLMYAIGAAALVFIAAGIYLHLHRKKSENVFPAPFLNPPRKRKPAKE